jgi:hypothetical protein
VPSTSFPTDLSVSSSSSGLPRNENQKKVPPEPTGFISHKSLDLPPNNNSSSHVSSTQDNRTKPHVPLMKRGILENLMNMSFGSQTAENALQQERTQSIGSSHSLLSLHGSSRDEERSHSSTASSSLPHRRGGNDHKGEIDDPDDDSESDSLDLIQLAGHQIQK